MKRLNKKPQDKKVFICPQCKKQRMVRLMDHVVDYAVQEYKTKDKTVVQLCVDVCDHCKSRNQRIYFEPTKADVKRILKAMQENTKLDENQSLEDLL